MFNHVTGCLFIAIAVFATTDGANGACKAPQYRGGRVWVDAASEIAVDVSIRLEDFAPSRLTCLAGALKRAYSGRNIAAYVFSSHEAAVGYLPTAIDPSPDAQEYQTKLHGYYFYNSEKHEEYLLIFPNRNHQEVDSPLITRIDLPAERVPTCKLAIHNRCLLEFREIHYPPAGNRANVSGTVTIAATIRRDGAVSDVKLAAARVDSEEAQPLFVNSAIQNLKTWRFETSGRKESLRITYRFELSDSPPTGWRRLMQFRLPDEVTIESVRAK
jgi:TonB family protein